MEHIRKDGHTPDLPGQFRPNINLDTEACRMVLEILNHTLADESVLATKTRSAYWNVSGPGFLKLRTLYNSHYQQLNGLCNETAERIWTLGGKAVCTLREYVKNKRLEERPGTVPDILSLLTDHEASIRFLREESRICTEEYGDQGTYELLIKGMLMHEKMAWMLRSQI